MQPNIEAIAWLLLTYVISIVKKTVYAYIYTCSLTRKGILIRISLKLHTKWMKRKLSSLKGLLPLNRKFSLCTGILGKVA